MRRTASVGVITLAGELELSGRDALAAALRIPENARTLLIDCSAVTYADSTALSELLRLHKEARAEGVRTAMIVVLPQFARLIRYAGLQHAFAVFDDRGAALTYLADGGVP